MNNEIKRGMQIGLKEEAQTAAKKFMDDNGYRTNMQGKMVACNDVSQLIEDKELSTAVQTAIMAL